MCARSDLKERIIKISCMGSIPVAVVSTISTTMVYDIASGTPICTLGRVKSSETGSWEATSQPIVAGNDFFLSTSVTAGGVLNQTREELKAALQRMIDGENGGNLENEKAEAAVAAASEAANLAWEAYKGCRRCSTNVSISFAWDVLCDAYPSFAKAVTAATGFDRPTAAKQIFLLSTAEQRKDPEARLELLLMGPPGMHAQPYGVHARTDELVLEAGEAPFASEADHDCSALIGTAGGTREAGEGGGKRGRSRRHHKKHLHSKHYQETSIQGSHHGLPTHFGVQSGASLLSQDLMLSQHEAHSHTRDTLSRRGNW